MLILRGKTPVFDGHVVGRITAREAVRPADYRCIQGFRDHNNKETAATGSLVPSCGGGSFINWPARGKVV